MTHDIKKVLDPIMHLLLIRIKTFLKKNRSSRDPYLSEPHLQIAEISV